MTPDSLTALAALLAAAEMPALPWSSEADQQPWPDEASDHHLIFAADGKTVFGSRNWKNACLAIQVLVAAVNDLPALIEAARREAGLRSAALNLVDSLLFDFKAETVTGGTAAILWAKEVQRLLRDNAGASEPAGSGT